MVKNEQGNRVESRSHVGEKLTVKVENVAQAFLELLSLRGIEYFFANSGTDMASIVDAFAMRQKQGKDRPRPMTIPHELPLVSMVHGYYLSSGKPQMAMVHVGIGTANAVGALMAASRGRIPILMGAGRTPISEMGSPASRDVYIHWGQESFDQAGMIREYVKWDYELRIPSQLELAVDRALAIAMTEPRGPVYLMMPREVLASPLKEVEFQVKPRFDLPTFAPDATKIQEAADLLIQAEAPFIITSSVGRNPNAVKALVDLTEAGAIGVISFNPEYMNFPADHACHQGFNPDGVVPQADLLLVVDCDVPWYPRSVTPKNSTAVIQIGVDPLYERYPIRGFPSDLSLQGDSAMVLSDLARALKADPRRDEDKIRARRKKLGQMHDGMFNDWRERALKAAHDKPLDFDWVSYHVNGILGEDVVLVNEFDMQLTQISGQRPGTYFSLPHAGYLGWGVGTALGVKLAAQDRTVIATVGDGCYIFSVPSACHFVSSAYQIPILVIIFNNQCWSAVKQTTRSVHPDGWAVRTNHFPLCDLEPTGHYEKICEAFGGYGERVHTPDQVGPALERALRVVREEKRQAVLNVICKNQ
jgi:acetolactate synthase-1/2/3 large subunit